MDDRLDLGDQERCAALGVPDDVQVDLGVVIARHGMLDAPRAFNG